MPLTKRLVEPVHLCRERIPAGIKNELEFVSNNALANVILQLSNLSRHAEDIFAELTTESQNIIHRSSSLKNRIDRLSVKVTQLDSNVEEVPIHDINIRKQFRSSNNCDQQALSRDTLPNAMKDVYDLCDPPPPLNRLNQFRTDGKDGLKFYTDPDYFFELWKQKMLEVGERHRPDKSKKPGRARTPNETKIPKVRQPQTNVDAMRAKAQEANFATLPVNQAPTYGSAQPNYPFTSDSYGAPYHNIPTAADAGRYGNYDAGRYGTIRSQSRPARLDLPSSYDAVEPTAALEETVHMVDYRALSGNSAASATVSPLPVSAEAASRINLRGTPTRPSQPPPAPPSSGSGPQSSASTRSTPTSSRDNFPPPPPEMHSHGRHSPTPPMHQEFPPPPGMDIVAGSGASVGRVSAGPPPPPPPPSGGILSSAPNLSTKSQMEVANASKKPATVQVSNTMLDVRSDLLKAIRNGINLRKVEQQKAEQQSSKVEETHKSLHNVAEILMRRKAIQHSDSDTSSETEADSEWDEHN